jgi:hypothetical protein
VAKEVPTIDEVIKRKIEKAKNWEKANPGLSWCDSGYAVDEPKIYISKELINSLAYRSLSRAALLIYQDFLAKRIMKAIKRNRKKFWVTENNGEIIYPYSEALKKGFSKTIFRNAIDELQAKGLIDITHRGKGGRKPAKGAGDVTTYWIDDRWEDYGTIDFKPPRNLRYKDTRKNRGFALLYADKKKAEAMIEKRNMTNRINREKQF